MTVDRRKRGQSNLRFLITLGIATVLLAVLVWLLIAILGGKPERKTEESSRYPTVVTEAPAEEISTLPTVPPYEGPAMLPHMMEQYLKNPDIVAWVGLPDGNGSGIALEGANEKKLPALRSGCSLDPESAVLVVQHSGTPLRNMVKYREETYWQENGELPFSTRFEKRTYQVVAAFVQKTEERDFTRMTVEEIARDIADKAFYDTGVSVASDDRLLILEQTVRSGEDFVLVAKLKTE